MDKMETVDQENLITFSLELPDDMSDDDIEEYITNLDLSTLVDASSEQRILDELQQSADPGIPAPGQPISTNSPTPGATSRFKKTTPEERKQYEDANQSKSTKRNTQWGLSLFQEWSLETTGEPTDFHNIEAEELARKLAVFYCEAKPKNKQQREKQLPGKLAQEYHKNTLKNIRGAINRHIEDIGRNIDIVRDKEFKTANNTLNGYLKKQMRAGLSRPTQHKKVIEQNDLSKIATYLENAPECPVILRYAVWYCLVIHFVSRGTEFHQQLNVNSFSFLTDENGEYAHLNHETQQKNYSGGLSSNEAPTDKRMYASPNSQLCPVRLLKLLIEKTDPNAEKLFNQYLKDADVNSPTWFSSKPLASRTYTNFMADISKAAGVDRYTNHCLRATAIQHMNDCNFEARHILFMTGHRSESSLRSYNRSFSASQKHNISNALSDVVQGNSKEHASGHEIVPFSESVNNPVTLPLSSLNQQATTTSFTSGFLSNSVFNGCHFNFSGPQLPN